MFEMWHDGRVFGAVGSLERKAFRQVHGSAYGRRQGNSISTSSGHIPAAEGFINLDQGERGPWDTLQPPNGVCELVWI